MTITTRPAPKPTAKRAAAGTRARQAQDSRDRILKAAIKVFAQRGYDGGRIERISSLAKTYDG